MVVQLRLLLVMRPHPLRGKHRPSLVPHRNNSPWTQPLTRNTGTLIFISRLLLLFLTHTDDPGLNTVMT